MVRLAYLLAGALVANAIPHLAAGCCGHAFPSPFATPPGVGLSSAETNALWGSVNLALAYAVHRWAAPFAWRRWDHAGPWGLGFVGCALGLAHHMATVTTLPR